MSFFALRPLRLRECRGGYRRRLAGLAAVDPLRADHLADEDLAVVVLVGAGGSADRLHHRFDQLVGHHRLDLHHRHESDLVFRAPVHLGMVHLPVEPLDLARNQAGNPDSTSAACTGSSLCGLTTALISFIGLASFMPDQKS